ncbi:MAG: hypothetical protein CFE45_00225 [Burkholderiales bacterium PBB5]|nr:MAG: hypothetical protein CFE45_00225 [Burkholderiales bacterium PBB5]
MKLWLKLVVQVALVLGISSSHAGAYDDFFRAVALDDDTTVTALLQRGFDPNSRDDKGQSALYLALRHGHDRVTEALLAHPQLALEQRNAAGETALMMAALRGRRVWVERLLDKGAALAPAEGGWTALHYAASGPDAATVALLVQRGAPLDSRSPNGSTALMMAAGYGPDAAVDLLLAAGADRTLRNQRALTAADFARGAGREALAQRLAPRPTGP